MMKNKKIKTEFILLIVLTVLLTVNTSALGITPGRKIINFEPGLEQRIDFTVINSEYNNLGLEVSVKGKLARYVKLKESSFSMSPNEYSREEYYDIKLPEILEPGLYSTDIIVVENTGENVEGKDPYIGGKTAVVTQLNVNVPYPGKYIDAKLLNSEDGRNFYITLEGKGDEKIDELYANITLYDLAENVVRELRTNNVSLKSGERKEISAGWRADVAPGEYIAKAKVYYDGKELVLNKRFKIKDKFLELREIKVENFKLGEITLLNLNVKNWWNEQISDASAEFEFYKGNNKIGETKSSPYSIAPQTDKDVRLYWDTAGLEDGLYNAKIILNYEEKKSEENLKMNISKNGIEFIDAEGVISINESGNIINKKFLGIMLGMIALVIILFAVWIAVVKKSKKINHFYRR